MSQPEPSDVLAEALALLERYTTGDVTGFCTACHEMTVRHGGRTPNVLAGQSHRKDCPIGAFRKHVAVLAARGAGAPLDVADHYRELARALNAESIPRGTSVQAYRKQVVARLYEILDAADPAPAEPPEIPPLPPPNTSLIGPSR